MKIISRKTAFRIFILFVLLVVVAGGLHLYWRWTVEKYRKQLQAKGEKLTVTELTPGSASSGENGAEIFLKAASLLNTNHGVLDENPPPAMHMVTPGKAMIGWAQSAVRDEAQRNTNSWQEIEAALATESQAIQLFQDITNHPVLDFNLTYELNADQKYPHLALLQRAAQILTAATLSDLHREDVASATADLHTLLTLIRSLQDEDRKSVV